MPTNAPNEPAARLAFAKRLKSPRIQAGYQTTLSLATKMNIDVIRYSRWERGDTEPDIPMIAELCRVLCVTPNDLLLNIDD
jgi:transcriptional regulator with XRE-family HTH domain